MVNMFKDDMVIVAGARTAVGKYGGSLSAMPSSEIGAVSIKEAVKRAGIDPADVDEVVMGCVGSVAEDAFSARLCAIKAGLPVESTASTVNRLCSSGLQSIVTAALQIDGGFTGDIAVAGGTENMSNLPFYLRKARFGYGMGNAELEDGLVTALSDPFTRNHMGWTAENVAKKYNISRERQDEYSLTSQQRARAAIDAGLFKDQIVPVTIKAKKEEFVFDTDEHPRDTTLEKLGKLRPAFVEGGTVTAGNSSGINDGSAATVVMKASTAAKRGVKPIVYIRSAAAAGVDPSIMGTGPIPAVRKLLKKTGLQLSDIGLIELNEAFASQSLACIDTLGIDLSITNVNGSGISLGHPIGATGAVITVKLMYEMRRRGVKYGMCTLCIGGGQGLAVLFELCE